MSRIEREGPYGERVIEFYDEAGRLTYRCTALRYPAATQRRLNERLAAPVVPPEEETQ